MVYKVARLEMRTGHNKIKIFTSTILLFSLSFVVLFSSPASALDITQNVTFVKGYSYPYWSDSNGRTYAQGRYDYITNGNYASSNAQYFRTDTNSALTASAGQYVSLTSVVIISVTSTSQAVSIQANPRQYFGMVGSSSSVDCPLIDLTETAFQQTQTGNDTWMLRYNLSSVCRLKSNVTNNVAMNYSLNGGSASGVDMLRFVPVYIGVWKVDDGFDDTDIINAINSLNNKLTTINNTLNSVNSALGLTNDKLDDMLDGIGNLNTLQQQANDDANDRYDDEKDTINNAASDAESNASGQDFNFSIPNPLQSWFGGFSDSECIDIPNLAQWIHSNETHICTPWPSSVRTVMTTIVTGLVMLLLFGFIIHWVKKNDTGGN